MEKIIAIGLAAIIAALTIGNMDTDNVNPRPMKAFMGNKSIKKPNTPLPIAREVKGNKATY